jgi:TonB family protein
VTYSNLIAVFLVAPLLFAFRSGIAAEPAATEAEVLDFGRSCAVAAATEEILSGPGVTLPHLTPKWPPKAPPYPKEAKKRKESGAVQMLLLVNEEGYVTRARLVKSSGSKSLDRASLESSKDFRLEPGRLDGKVTCMWMPFTSTWIGSY